MNTDVSRIISKTITKEVGSYSNGGYTEDPDDPGGATKWGIAKRYHPNEDIKNLTRVRATEIYFQEYYQPLELDPSWRIDFRYYLFDCAVNPGPGVAKRWKGLVLSLLSDFDTALETLKRLRSDYYRARVAENPVKRKNLNGWLRRAADLGADLL